MAYISPDVKDFFFSKEAMIQLGIINSDFPQLGVTSDLQQNLDCQAITEDTNMQLPEGCQQPPQTSSLRSECGCLKRQLPPPIPESLPFPFTPENRSNMKHWLLERYAASTFNKCPIRFCQQWKAPQSRSIFFRMQSQSQLGRQRRWHCIGRKESRRTSFAM